MQTDLAAGGLKMHNVGSLLRIPLGEGRSFHVEGVEIAVFRTRGGEIFAVDAHCPHRGGPLVDGLVGGGRVICPLHSYVFELATGRPVREACAHLRTYPIAVTPSADLLIGLERPEED